MPSSTRRAADSAAMRFSSSVLMSGESCGHHETEENDMARILVHSATGPDDPTSSPRTSDSQDGCRGRARGAGVPRGRRCNLARPGDRRRDEWSRHGLGGGAPRRSAGAGLTVFLSGMSSKARGIEGGGARARASAEARRACCLGGDHAHLLTCGPSVLVVRLRSACICVRSSCVASSRFRIRSRCASSPVSPSSSGRTGRASRTSATRSSGPPAA